MLMLTMFAIVLVYSAIILLLTPVYRRVRKAWRRFSYGE